MLVLVIEVNRKRRVTTNDDIKGQYYNSEKITKLAGVSK